MDGAAIRGLVSDFPYPVFTVMSVTDRDTNHVRGLANTTKWVGGDTLAETGVRISEIWQPVLEIQNQTAFDLYQQRPSALFTEISDTARIPISAMLLMDVSGSIRAIPNALDSAKAGVRRFVENMRPVDRASVIAFSCDIKRLPFTSDKLALTSFVDSLVTGPWTPLYQAILEGIEAIEAEKSLRRAVVLYTDGKNALPGRPSDCPEINRREANEDSVINAAKQRNIPLYVVALGNSTSNEILQRIAIETGGHFFKTDSGAHFSDIYEKISDAIQNYYVMAHTAPQPCNGDTLRVVDVTVNDSQNGQNRSDRAVASYTVSEDEENFDLAIARIDSPDRASAGDTIRFVVTIENRGPATATNLALRDSLSNHLVPVPGSFEPVPDSEQPLIWQFDSLAPFQNLNVVFKAKVDDTLPAGVSELCSFVQLTAECDTDSSNNTLFHCIKIGGNYDLRLSKYASKDTVCVNEEFDYTLVVKNLGPATAFNFRICDTIPALLTPSPHDTVLCWSVDSLAAQDSLIISYKAKVDSQLPVSPIPLINVGEVIAANDTNAFNNVARDTIVAIDCPPQNYDLQLTKRASKDTVCVNEEFDYTLVVTNLGPTDAFDITVRDTLPNLIQPINVDSLLNNVAVWHLGSLAVGADTTIRYAAKVVGKLSRSPLPLINSAVVRAPQDTNAANDTASATVVAIDCNYDLQLTKRASTDTVCVNEEFDYILVVTNLGPAAAFNILVSDTIPDLLTPSQFDSISGNVLFWRVDLLASSRTSPDTVITLSYKARVASQLPSSPITLINTSAVSATNDTSSANNVARASVVAITECPVPCTDLSISKSASKDSVRIGEPFFYTLTVSNLGSNPAFNITVRDSISEFITPDPNVTREGDVLVWRIAALSVNQTATITFSAQINAAPAGNAPIPNSARIIYGCNTNTSNNVSPPVFVTPVPDFSRGGCEFFRLDFNVFEPEKGAPLGIHFEFNTSRVIRLDVYDISGYHIRKLVDDTFAPGPHRFDWDGQSTNGQKIGAGVYVITLRSSDLICWKKVIVAR